MKRIYLIFFAAVCALLVSFDAVAQERLIAVIMAASQPRYEEIQSAFEKQADPFCGSDCKIYVQTPNTDTMSLRNSVRKAIALDAELIVTYGPAATLAAQLEAPAIAVLFADVYDPVNLGLVAEKTGVGRRMSGVRGDVPVQALFKYFVETTGAKTLTVLFDAECQVGTLQLRTLEESGQRRDVKVSPLSITGARDHLDVLSQMPPDTDGLFLASSDHPAIHLDKVISYATERKVPVITQRAGAAEKGAFMTVETSAEEQGIRLAKMAEKLLSGADIAELPLEKAHDVSFVVNLNAARACDIKVPFTVLSNATRIVR